MPTEVIMPKVDMDMEEGTIALWHVSDGERVEKDAPLFDIETDKAAMEVESPASGTLHNIIAPAGTKVEIGKPVAWIYADGEDVGAPPGSDQPAGQNATENGLEAANEDPAAGDAAPAGTPAPTDAPPSPPVSEDKPRATPAARRRAKQLEISLHSVEGTGPRGRIQKHDVEAAAAKTRQPETAREPAPAEVLAAAPAPSVRTDAAAAPFVLIHGFAADAAGWAPLRRALGQTVPTHTIELAGHGRQPSGDVTDFSSLVLAVRDELEGLGLAEAHLVGHSLGGAVALAIADQRPSAVATLTLISPAGLGPEIDGATIDGIARATKAESLAPWLK
ncbi:MAG: alpha/beta fold hydrolase, partial [Pseudomonadota bacterium]